MLIVEMFNVQLKPEKAEKEGKGFSFFLRNNKCNKYKIVTNKADIYLTLSIITLNVHGLNALTERQGLSGVQ